jgi:hypothetical protein
MLGPRRRLRQEEVPVTIDASNQQQVLEQLEKPSTGGNLTTLLRDAGPFPSWAHCTRPSISQQMS